jgi:hypothetical protein
LRTLTAPSSCGIREIVGFSESIRLRGGALPSLNKLHEISLNTATMAFDVLPAPDPKVGIVASLVVASLVVASADHLFRPRIWGFGIEPVGFRWTYPVEVNSASDRAFDFISREKYGPLSEAEDAEFVTLLPGFAGQLFKPESFGPDRGITYDDCVALSLQNRGVEGLRISGAWTTEEHNDHIGQFQEPKAAVEQRT